MTYGEAIKIENKAEIYANGVCSQPSGNGIGGWGALIYENGVAIQIYGGDPCTTSNKMEIIGCIKALNSLSQKSVVKITINSKYVIQGAIFWVRKWKKNGWLTKFGEPVKNRELWEILDNLCKNHIVSWVFSGNHSNDRGNQIAEGLAVSGKEEEKEKIRKSIYVRSNG